VLASSAALRFLARKLQDRVLGLRRGISDLNVQQEPVELRLGQRIGAVLLDRVLRRHHHEQLGQAEACAPDAHLALFHRLEQRRLHLRRRAIDLVGEHQVAEQRPGAEFERAGLGAKDLGAGDVGRQQVGRELDAVEVGFEQLGERLDRGGLGESRDALDEHMAVAQQRDQQAAASARIGR
jgi:hypothetical protein